MNFEVMFYFMTNLPLHNVILKREKEIERKRERDCKRDREKDREREKEREKKR